MMQQLMNSPMVQQMMSNPETGSEGSENRILIVLTDGLAGDYFDVEKEDFLPIPQEKTCQKRSFILMKHIELPDSFVLGNFPCIKTY